jgi:pilus assembly protein CpaE
MIVANKVAPGVGEISRSDFETSIERKLSFVIPHDVKAAANAAKLGQTFVGANRAAKTTAAIRMIVDAIIATEGEHEAAPVVKGGKLGGKGGAKPAPAEAAGAKGANSMMQRFAIKKLLTKSKAGAGA